MNPRFMELRTLENLICAFDPDFDETADLIAAVLSTIKGKYPNHCHDLDQQAEKLTKIIEGMDDNIFPYEPDLYDRWRDERDEESELESANQGT